MGLFSLKKRCLGDDDMILLLKALVIGLGGSLLVYCIGGPRGGGTYWVLPFHFHSQRDGYLPEAEDHPFTGIYFSHYRRRSRSQRWSVRLGRPCLYRGSVSGHSELLTSEVLLGMPFGVPTFSTSKQHAIS